MFKPHTTQPGGSSPSPATTTSSIFGGHTAVFGQSAQTTPVFGHSGPSASVFGGVPGNTQGKGVFGGGLGTEPKLDQGKSIFGQSVKPPPAYGVATQGNTAQTQSNTSTTTPSFMTSSGNFKNVFGQTSGPAQSNPFSSKPSGDDNLFGNVKTSTSNIFTGAKASDTTPVFKSVFGAPEQSAAKPEFKSVFGDQKVNEVTDSTNSGSSWSRGAVPPNQTKTFNWSGDGQTKNPENVVEDERRKPQVLFGKPATSSISDKANLLQDEDSGQGSPQRPVIKRQVQVESSGVAPRAARGLFAKALSGVAKRTGTVDTSTTPDELQTEASKPATSLMGMQRVSRRLSVEELSNKTALIIKNIPPQYCSSSFLKTHFSKYGLVKRIYPNLEKKQATIHFATHEIAAAAKVKGRILRPGKPPLQIFWSNYSPAGKVGAVRRTSREKPVLSEVDSELSSMSGTEDVVEERVKSLERPEEAKLKSRPREVRRREPKDMPVPPAFPRATSPSPSSPQRPTRQSAGISNLKSAYGKTGAERLEILIQYDKLLRQGLDKRTDIKKAKIFVGTCQDMCPEKERYLREDRRRVHYYEMVHGTENIRGQNPVIDHARAVKEYSRASADQEEPLPHELRPGPALDISMTYLLNNIMDAGGDGKWRDWYEFLWDRTRGIRKDITQQNLCDQTAAGLVEKCARFHIYCAERLCEEDVNTFDVKINNENLTKCLQTLKEIYYDLYRNKNATCPSEPEFRAYMVLMNLNEGDILREVQNLREEVRNTAHISFVVQVYSALNSNNYVKFFKLAKKASFLMACIMHRYFNQVRSMALLTMLRAFTIGKQSVDIPICDLVRQLAFENDVEAMAFCVHHGLKVEDGCVHFDRSLYIQPESALEARRAINLIESKLRSSVGEVVNGSPLPPNIIHQPTSYFDETGRFCADMGTIHENVEVAPVVTPIVQEVTVPTPFQEPQRPITPVQKAYSNEAVKEVAKDLFIEVIREMCNEMSEGLMGAIKAYLNTSIKVEEELRLETCSEMIRELSEQALTEERMRDKERRAIEAERRAREAAILAASRERAVVSIGTSMLEDIVKEEIQEAGKQEFIEVQKVLRQQSIQRSTQFVTSTLVDEVVREAILDVSKDVYETDVRQRLQVLAECEASIKLLRTAHFLKRWRNRHAKALRLKKSMYNFPSAPNMQSSRREILDNILPERDTTDIERGLMPFNKKARLIVDSPNKVRLQQQVLSNTLSAYYYLSLIQNKKAWSPLDVPDIIGHHLLKALSVPRTQWKLIVSLPDQLDNAADCKTLCDWIRAKFSKGARETNGRSISRVLSSYSKSFDEGDKKSQISICVRTIEGTLNDEDVQSVEEDSLLLGSSALLFVLPPCGDANMKEYWLTNQVRLTRVVQAKPGTPSMPLVIVTWDCGAESLESFAASLTESSTLYLDTFVGKEISAYEVLSLGDNLVRPESSDMLAESIKWLSINSQAPPLLTSKPVRDYIEEMLAAEFYTPVYQDLARRKSEGLLHQPPNILIELYNSVICHLQVTACSYDFTDLSWPIPEFLSKDLKLPNVGWNSEEHLDYLSQLFDSLMLPDFCYEDDTREDWQSVCSDVWQYVDDVCSGNLDPQLITRIRMLLKKAERNFEYTCLLTYDERDCEPCALNVPWTDIIAACVHYLLLSFQINVNSDEDLNIHYLSKDYDTYVPPKSWKFASAVDDATDLTLDDTVLHCTKRKQEIERSTPAKITRLSERIVSIPLDVTSIQDIEASETARELANALAREKHESAMFDKLLQSALSGGDDLEMSASSAFVSPTFTGGLFMSSPTLNGDSFGTRRNSLHAITYLRTPPGFRSKSASPKTISRRVLGSPQNDLLRDDDFNEDTLNMSIADKVSLFQQGLESERQADRLFEMKLQKMITE